MDIRKINREAWNLLKLTMRDIEGIYQQLDVELANTLAL